MFITIRRIVGQCLPYNENQVVESNPVSFEIIIGLPDTSLIHIGEHEVELHNCYAGVLSCVDKVQGETGQFSLDLVKIYLKKGWTLKSVAGHIGQQAADKFGYIMMTRRRGYFITSQT
jgi:hypothetical protein